MEIQINFEDLEVSTNGFTKKTVTPEEPKGLTRFQEERYIVGGHRDQDGRWMKSFKTDLLNSLQDIYRSYPTMHKIIPWLIMRYMVFNSIYSIWLYEDVFEGFLLNYNEDVDRGCCEVSTV
eukprot:snap_masked-scaffold_1-processed-gene-5.5-mRNA-1 protein AED:1.00 eAED:1.00 QI:0/0/0/0/1/1/3/0/120